MVDCPDETDLAGFVSGSLDKETLDVVEQHLDDCQACSMVVADLVRIFDDSAGPGLASGGFSDPDPSGGHGIDASDQGLPTLEGTHSHRSVDGDGEDHDRPTLPAGAEVGRYRVLECIGFGGMGVVYSAYDPKLDRRVALKVLRAGTGNAADETRKNARLLREAKVMAKLSHQNVIVVHDVGSYEERVFLAMEFVDGTTMGRWMRTTERNWKEVRDVFLAAGRGLAAAHDAGLVHRDFKPDNVLIGDDGRVRVTDFGLARFRDESIEQSLHGALPTEPSDLHHAGFSPTLATLTKTGVLVGTPAYMAPEQYKGGTVSAATDQFSFCVALYEALYGERPFEGRSLAELATNVCSGNRRALREASVPPRIRDAILRGLSLEPKERFANMNALLLVLNRRPTKTLRRWAMVGVPTLVAAGSLWWDASPAVAGAPLCRKDASIANIWGEGEHKALASAFDAANDPLAGPGAERALDALDRYADDWESAREQLCEGGAADGLHGSEVLQSHCLMRARSRLAAVLSVLSSMDASVVRTALQAVEGLPDVSQCVGEQVAAANLVPLPPMESEIAVGRVREDLDRAYAMSSAGKAEEAAELVGTLEETITGLDYAPLGAELAYVTGHVRMQQGRFADARNELQSAAMLGIESHHRSVAADAWTHLVFIETNMFDDYDAARRALRHARAEVKALGEPPRMVNRLRAHEGGLAIKEGRNEEALAIYEALLDDTLNEPPLRRADILINLVSVYTELGRWDEALASCREYIDVYESTFGESHPYLALGYYNLGFTYYAMDRFEDALVPMLRSLKVGEETLPANHPDLSHTHSALGIVLIELQRYDEALVHLERALEILDPKELSAEQRVFHQLGLAEARIKAGRFETASSLMDEIDKTLASFEKPDHGSHGRLLTARAELAETRGDLEGAQAFMEEAVAVLANAVAMRTYLVAEAKVALAGIAIKRDDAAYARELAQDVQQTQEPNLENLRKRAAELEASLPTAQ